MRMNQHKVLPGLQWETAFLWGSLAAATICASAGPAAAQKKHTADGDSSVKVMSEIDDPSLGTRWLLRCDPAHPGGPGVMAAALYKHEIGATAGAEPVIHGGDRLIIEENSSVVTARLEGIALGTATAGSSFQARLRIGGKVVHVIALGLGQALLVPEHEVRQ